MAKLDARRIGAFLKDPGACRVVLLYGEDAGLVRERAEALRQAVVGGDDPFRVAEVPRDLAAKAGVLSGEVAALSMIGGRRLVRVRDAGDAVAPAVKEALAGQGEALLLLEAGELPGRSKLRALLEAEPAAAVIACYRERGAELAGTIGALLREQGVAAEPAVLDWLAARLGQDRLLLRREVEKLALFVGPGGRVDEAAAMACVGDGLAMDVDEALLAATAGEVAVADAALDSALAEGASPITVLRAAQRHVQRLSLALSAGMDGLRPPVFFRHKPRFERALRLWSEAALAAAASGLRLAEIRAKSGSAQRPLPDGVAVRAAVLALARQAAVRARG